MKQPPTLSKIISPNVIDLALGTFYMKIVNKNRMELLWTLDITVTNLFLAKKESILEFP